MKKNFSSCTRIVQHNKLFHHQLQSYNGLFGTKEVIEVLFRVVFTTWHALSPLTFSGVSPTVSKRGQGLKEKKN